jgi:hypothetical protein
MLAGTSPSIAKLSNGTYQAAFQANSGTLYTWNSSSGTVNLGQGMLSGTSPSIAAVGTGYQIAFQANTGELIAVGSAGNSNTGQGMKAGTSPSITAW